MLRYVTSSSIIHDLQKQIKIKIKLQLLHKKEQNVDQSRMQNKTKISHFQNKIKKKVSCTNLCINRGPHSQQISCWKEGHQQQNYPQSAKTKKLTKNNQITPYA